MAPSKKRKAVVASKAPEDEGLGRMGSLELGSDEDRVEVNGKRAQQQDGAEADGEDWSGDEEDGDFPELFLSEEEDDEGESEEEELANGADESESEQDEEDPDVDEDASSDSDAPRRGLFDDGEDAAPTPSTSNPSISLDALIARSITKPDEADRTLENGNKEETDYLKLARMRPSRFVEGVQVREWDEIEPGYDSASSTEDAPNRIGNVPAHFYDDMPHIGYDMDGKKVLRPAKADELDKFLRGIEDPSSWTSVEDKLLQQNVQLTDEELDIIRRLVRAENPDANYDPYEPLVEVFTGKGKEMVMPLTGKPEPKRRFIPSKWEHKKVMKIVRAIRQGRIVPRKPTTSSTDKRFYAIWSSDDAARPPGPMHMPAPKLRPPGHAESYNPPEEYLFNDEEKAEWEATEPRDRRIDHLPAKYPSLRRVPGYGNFVQERFERLLDLYLAPRMIKKKRPDVKDPDELLPKLPSPRELRPFPTSCAVEYPHERTRVRCVAIDPTGEWVATGAEDGEVRLWEAKVGRCAMRWKVAGGESGPVYGVEWCPEKDRSILAVAVAGKVVLLSPLQLLSPTLHAATLEAAHAGFTATASSSSTPVPDTRWSRASERARDAGILLEVLVPGTPRQVAWHRRGDYFSTFSPDATNNRSVLVHQLSKHSTQAPFRRTKGQVQKVSFHPTKPWFLVATQRFVRVYDLVGQKLERTLQPGLKWVSSLDVHPGGDNVIVGSYDKRLAWVDMDLSDKPYKTLRYHAKAIRSVAFSPRWPLFLTTSDDGTVQIFHATVYSDLATNALIVPLKVIKAHEVTESLGVLEAKWHPREPWVVSVGADGKAKLWTP